MFSTRLLTLAAVSFASVSNLQAAALVTVAGDLAGAFGTASTLPINTPSSVQSFSITSGGNTLVGDAITTNDPSGTIFTMTITNLVFTCVTPNSSNSLDVTISVNEHYAMGTPGPFMGDHAISGTFGGGAGPLTTAILDSTHGVSFPTTTLPTITASSSPFNVSSLNNPVPAGPMTQYVIQGDLRLHIDGTGNITLPSSADIVARALPEPGSLGLLGLGGMMMLRRKRKN